jgi:protoporphyrinogen/coproporphyrinogen III oxidase
MRAKRIVIVGGGISGLAAAHRFIELRGNSADITLLEASSRLGGIIQTEHRDGFLLERGPDSFISEKPEGVALAKRLESRLIQTNEQFRRSFIVRNGRLRPVPEGFQLLAPSRVMPFLTTDIFSVAGKIRMAADLLLPRHKGNDDESLASFVRRRLGKEALERMAQPMVGGIYTADPETLSLRATLPRFLDMERTHRSLILAMMRQGQTRGTSGARYSLFLSFDGGMEVFISALASTISNVRLNTRIKELALESGTWQIKCESGSIIEADAVCLAVPAYIAGQLLANVNERLAAQLNAIKYASTATINLAYPRSAIRHPLNGFGFVVPFVEKRSLIACTFSNLKFNGRAPEAHVLLRAFAGGALQPDVFASPDMETRIEADLRELLGITGEPLFKETARWERSMPQYEVGHLDRVQAIENEVKNLPGLVLAGNSYRGAGIPDCIRSGEAAAESLVNFAA